MPLANSRIIPMTFWVAFLALGLLTNSSHDKRPVRHSRGWHELNVADASAGKRAIGPHIKVETSKSEVVARD
jgi:hypothetical protein